ncbi:hypothetical protein R4Z10_20565 [Niallia sp. XMNu-256]|uniref:hypothetical protein n=1 Tax=Niallia sp. XMNu-256 TaxID=3082444 RepID=UPI0030D4361C
MKRFLELISNEIKRNYYILKNYKFAFFTNIISNLIFIGIFLSVITAIFDLSQGFMMILWPVMLALIGAGGDNIRGDMQLGILERIVSRNTEFKQLLIARILADGVWTLPIVLLIGGIFSFLSVDGLKVFLQISIAFFPLFIGSLGIGLFVSGLTLYYKDTGSTVNIMMIVIMLCTILPWEQWLYNLKYIGALVIPFLSLNIFIQSNEYMFLIISIINSILVYLIGNKLFKYYFDLTKREKGFVRY